MNFLIPAIIVGGAWYLSKMQSTGEKLQKCEISSFKLGKLSIGLQQTTVPVELQIFNPNNTDVPAEYFRGIIRRAGVKVGDFTFDSGSTNVMLKRRGTTSLVFNVRITTIGAVRNIIDIFKNLLAARPVDTVFTIEGVIAISGFDIPVNFSYDVKTNTLVKSIGGIGKPYAKLEFNSNREMDEYFKGGCKQTVPAFSKN